jgi:hypothetical protein
MVKGAAYQYDRGSGDGLSTAAKEASAWPTPRASDPAKEGPSNRADQLPGAVHRCNGPLAEANPNTNGSRLGLSPGVLNADWVEALMGYPPDWTRIEPPD